MHRIDHATKDVDLFGSGKHGFTEGTPGTEAATVVTDDWLNDVQEEICNTIEATDTLVKGTRDQLLTTLQKFFNFIQLSNLTKLAPSGSPGHFYGSTATGSSLLVCGVAGAIQTCSPSSLGSTWTARTAAGSFSGDFYAAKYLPFLSTTMIAGTSGEIETGFSTWTQQTPAGSYSNTFRGISCSDTAAILVGLGGEIQRTANGTSFTEEKSSGSDLYAVTYSEDLDLFVAVGASGAIFTSSDDGLNWTSRTPAGSFSGTFYAAIYNEYDGKFYIAGGTGAAAEIQSSTDGITWAQESITSSNDVVALVLADRLPVAVAGNNFYAMDSAGDWQLYYRWMDGTPGLVYTGCFLTSYGLPLFAGNGGGIYIGQAFNRLEA